jgi:hypothetical protein
MRAGPANVLVPGKGELTRVLAHAHLLRYPTRSRKGSRSAVIETASLSGYDRRSGPNSPDLLSSSGWRDPSRACPYQSKGDFRSL